MSNNQLVIREVDFHGDRILSIKDNESDKIFVGISYICNGIGLTENQRDRQVKNIQSDLLLKKGSKMLSVKLDGQVRNVLCMELDYLPIWLAKIPITPKMQSDNKEVVDKLLDYQLKAKDVLANAFIDKGKFHIPQTYSEALKLAADFQSQLEEQKPKVELYDKLMNTEGLMSFKQVADSFGDIGRNTLMKTLRESHVLSSNKSNKNLPYSQYTKRDLFRVKITPIRTNNGIEEICTTLCTPKALPFIQKLLKKKDLLQRSNIN